ncbi:type I polyketide synthase [Pseudobacteriovorax antillogorgiicola]|uniref:Polyketide-type polyunsaturated fatty acid synthase PfaA n=1 Tax=Pseudobacteriovorax antillogorgiicola TaxID=1513793 RepID=A0A1Y6BWC9_9BACT|nr:type I polyketide synthase [Pseudobacteriovorax antillogorgiicola]TCS52274.1 polyketide-type polyunsaturated fatty acid synthase PfaA [Pseudobacteriovorax antillogorgiicola]SMF30762.1 polyketide-type polyunsaturated fatty acid synthase PfaA [Pseudobacteriovorax antillogorgiicola]
MSELHEPLAVVGIGCLFPESDSLEEYWSLIKNGRDAIREIPYTHWNPDDYYNQDPKAPDQTYGRTGGFLRPHKFDPLRYGISPQAIEATDTTQLLGMVVAEKALESAGYGPDQDFDRERTSCILGVTGTLELVVPLGARLGHPIWKKALLGAGLSEDQAQSIVDEVSDSYVPWQEASFPGLLGNVVAGRIANRFDLGGTNSVVDAACASSLSAIRTAAMELQSRRADMVITGGMDTFNDIFMYMCFSKTPALSKGGHAKPFDANGDGTVLGEGLGAVVLKRLSDAERDGDRIFAKIIGIGSSSDGKGKAIYAPSTKGQTKALRNAYREAGISPATVDLVECHGTGTKVGDGIELKALKEVYRDLGGQGQWCTIGSVKSQIGHTKAAAGAAGLIKAIMALHHKTLPPTIKVDEPHPEFEGSPFILRQAPCPWPKPSNHPRRAAISAFGFGGSNFHCILEEHGSDKVASDFDTDQDILVYSAPHREAMLAILEQELESLAKFGGAELSRKSRERLDLSHGLRVGILVANGAYESQLEAALKLIKHDANSDHGAPKGIFFNDGSGVNGKLAVLFSGQGSQYPGMLSQFMSESQLAQQSYSQALSLNGSTLSQAMYPGKAFTSGEASHHKKQLARTDLAQPAIGAVSAGLWKTLQEFGVKADLLGGHSFGELTALYAAGVYDEETFHQLAMIRGTLMASAASDLGGMMAIMAPVAQVQEFLDAHSWDLVIANHNAPEQAVIAGPKDQIDEASKALKKSGLRGKVLTVGAAFHSPIMANTVRPFYDRIAEFDFQLAQTPVYSNTLGKAYEADGEGIRKILSEQLAKSVRFVDELESMYQDGARRFLEVGPGKVLSGLVNKTLGHNSDIAIMHCDDGQGGVSGVLAVLLELFVSGETIDFSRWHKDWRIPHQQAPSFAIEITGANYKSDRPIRKAKSIKDANSNSNKQSETNNHTEHGPMDDSQNQSRDHRMDKHLEALQDMQKQTAELHRQFLENQAQSQRILHDLVLMQRGHEPTPGASAGSRERSDQQTSESRGMYSSVYTASDVIVPEAPEEKPRLQAAHETSVENQESEIQRKGATKSEAMPEGGAQDNVMTAVQGLIAEKTGYPQDMLSQEMSLEEDLGIDSIKRVEIFSALQDQFSSLSDADPEDLNNLRTIADIASYLGAEEVTVAHVDAVNPLPIANGNDTQSPVGSTEDKVLEIIGEKTGYPRDMLHMEMALEEDLGIDSIKRVEIISALQSYFPSIEQMAAEDLGDLRTVEQLVFALNEDQAVGHASGEGANLPKADHEAEPVAIEDAAQGLEEAIFTVIAEKTGYPTDMLRAEMELESDLGIDSIKRVEIFSTLGESYPELASADQEELADLQTLGDVIAYLDRDASDEGGSTSVEDRFDLGDVLAEIPAEEEDSPGADPDELGDDPFVATTELPRQILELETVDNLGNDIPNLEPGAKVWVCDDGSNLARNIVLKLREKGFKPKLVSTSFVDRLKAPDDLDGLIILGPVKLEGSPSRFLSNCFKMLKLCAPALKSGENKLFSVVTRNGGKFGLDGLDSLSQVYAGALSGLAKTVAREWPEIRASHIDLARDFSDGFEAAFRLIHGFIFGTDLELGVASQSYFRPRLVSADLDGQMDIDLGPEDTVIITGGARGVTACIAKQLAERTQARLVLWGRTERAKDLPDWALSGLSEADLKQKIMSESKLSSPKALESAYQQLIRKVELHQNIEAIKSKGSEVYYQTVDVSQESQMREALDKIEEKFGKVSGLIHGAGVLADHFIEELDDQDFQQVLDTKIKLIGLVEQRLLDLKYLALFSSSTGRFGRKGQLAYAVANEALNKFSQFYKKSVPNCHTVAINWGPWDGGMVNDGLKKLFTAEGIDVIPLEMGAEFLLRELALGDQGEVVAIATTGLRHAVDESELFSFESWPILKSHVMKHRGVVPSVVLMELMIAAAKKRNADWYFKGVSEFKVLKGITLAQGDQVRYELESEEGADIPGGRSIPVRLWSVQGGQRFLTASAEVQLYKEWHDDQRSAQIEIAGVLEKPSLDDVYGDCLFHGDDLQGLTSIRDLADEGVVGTSLTQAAPEQWARSCPLNQWHADPLALDVSFQLAVVWSQKVCGARCLPTGFRSYIQYRAFPKEGCEIRLKVDHRSAKQFEATIEYVADGQLIALMTGYAAVMDESLGQSFRENSLEEATAEI